MQNFTSLGPVSTVSTGVFSPTEGFGLQPRNLLSFEPRKNPGFSSNSSSRSRINSGFVWIQPIHNCSEHAKRTSLTILHLFSLHRLSRLC